jgi:hypothetical protein
MMPGSLLECSSSDMFVIGIICHQLKFFFDSIIAFAANMSKYEQLNVAAVTNLVSDLCDMRIAFPR